MKNTSNTNPLIDVPPTKLGAVSFDLIKPDHYVPALEKAIEQAKERLSDIKSSTDTPDFENTILALETSGQHVNWIAGIYFNLLVAETTEELQALAQTIGPLLSKFSNDTDLDAELFKKVDHVFKGQNRLDLNSEQIQLLTETHSAFVRNGALLSESDKQTLRTIDEELSKLSPQFSENVLKATNKYELHVTDDKDVEGLPKSALAVAKELALKSEKPGWIFTLHGPSLTPFITYCKNRELRKQILTAYNSRSFNDDFDNQENIKKITQLNFKRANLLGFSTYAEYVLQKRMAENPKTVYGFLDELLTYAKPAAEREIKELTAFAKKTDNIDQLQNWDTKFYIEKLKKEKFSFDDEDLRPYFKLENVIQGAFDHASKLYGVEFRPSNDYPLYHKDVNTYEVYKVNSDELVGLFYTDFFPRASKQGGAWMTVYLEQGIYNDSVQRPHVSIVCNFTPSTTDSPSLLTYLEVRTLFHEFGHALHGLLSDCTYQSIAGTNVYWDFVELPSQIMENWTLEKESLMLFAKHHQTGELIPDNLIKKLKSSSQFMAGLHNMRQLKLCALDMGWFENNSPDDITNVDDFESAATKNLEVLPSTKGTNISCSFSHIFGGGYAAGYYSYKWAEVLDADAFEYFQEKGVFNKEVSEKFKENILTKGGSRHPLKLYENFRGRKPDPKALLRRDGLI